MYLRSFSTCASTQFNTACHTAIGKRYQIVDVSEYATTRRSVSMGNGMRLESLLLTTWLLNLAAQRLTEDARGRNGQVSLADVK